MTDFTLPNGNTLRIDGNISMEIKAGTGEILWPYDMTEYAVMEKQEIETRSAKTSMAALRRYVNEANRKRNKRAQ